MGRDRDRDRDRDDDRRGGRRGGGGRDKCRFCRSEFPPDYKDIDTLERLITGQGKMYSRKRSGNCAHHQRMFALAVKQARFLALLSHVG